MVEFNDRRSGGIEAELARHMDPQRKFLYHGTDAEFKPGDVILPADKVGKDASGEPGLAYATPDLHAANFFAWEQNNHNGKNFSGEPTTENVYEVEPVDPTEQLKTETSPMLSFHPDWKNGGTADNTQVTSTQGFRVLSQVQHHEAIRNIMANVAADKRGQARETAALLFRAGRKAEPGSEMQDMLYSAGEKASERIP